MAQNKMKEVAKIFGVDLEEEFKIKYNDKSTYVFKEDGLFEKINDGVYSQCDIDNLLTGESELVKIPKPTLNEKEREYLCNVIKPFRDRISWIKKCEYDRGDFIYGEYIVMGLKFFDSGTDGYICADEEQIALPSFAKGTMYKGMELNKKYTLDELGL